MQSQYSSKDMPFQAKTGIPDSAMAAAAWSCVEKMLQLAHLTDAPKSTSVSIKTAVCIVMCRDPVILTPWRGFDSVYFSLIDIKPGISCSVFLFFYRTRKVYIRNYILELS